jgi:CRISPR/Cas system-associated exonuclease Cas4 (RecB family)
MDSKNYTLLEEESCEEPAITIRPYELNAWAVCPRKCWLLQRHLMMEAHSPYVELGRMLHQESQERAQREPDALTDIPIEDIARLDKLAGRAGLRGQAQPAHARRPPPATAVRTYAVGWRS